MEKVKLNQYKVMFKMTCAEISFWNFQPMKISLDWLFIFIFPGKNAFIFTFSWEGKIVFHAAVCFKLTAAFFMDMNTQAEVVTQAAWADLMQGFENDQNYPEIVLKREEPQDNKCFRAMLPCSLFALFWPQKSFASLIADFLHVTRQSSWIQSFTRNPNCWCMSRGRTGSCLSCGVWLLPTPNLTNMKVRMRMP